jgi:hypothetical protein
MADDTEVDGLDALGDAIGAERLHRILTHGANGRDEKIMRDFVRVHRDWRVRNTIAVAMESAHEQRLRALKKRRVAYRRKREGGAP